MTNPDPVISREHLDLKLIDQLLIHLMVSRNLSPSDIDNHNSITKMAMERLREAWKTDNYHTMTATWARYFGDLR